MAAVAAAQSSSWSFSVEFSCKCPGLPTPDLTSESVAAMTVVVRVVRGAEEVPVLLVPLAYVEKDWWKAHEQVSLGLEAPIDRRLKFRFECNGESEGFWRPLSLSAGGRAVCEGLEFKKAEAGVVAGDGIVVHALVLGSGTSEGVPRVSCLFKGECRVCAAAHSSRRSPNYRRNTSLYLVMERPDAITKYIVIDTGKYFKESAMDVLVPSGFSRIDAVIISHFHADATFGLDELRDWTEHVSKGYQIPVFIRDIDKEALRGSFGYLMGDASLAGGGGVSNLGWYSTEDNSEFVVEGIRVKAWAVPHGRVTSQAFRIGTLAWIADASEIPDVVTENLRDGAEVLFLDLLGRRAHPSHFNLSEFCEYVFEKLPGGSDRGAAGSVPRLVFAVGMSHAFEHSELDGLVEDSRLEKGSPPIHGAAGYDGLLLSLKGHELVVSSKPALDLQSSM